MACNEVFFAKTLTIVEVETVPKNQETKTKQTSNSGNTILNFMCSKYWYIKSVMQLSWPKSDLFLPVKKHMYRAFCVMTDSLLTPDHTT